MLVAAIQLTSTSKVDNNLERAENLIRRAASQGASLIALPENFAYLRSESESIEYKQSMEGDLIVWLKELVRELKIYLLAGSFPERRSEEKIFNTSILFNPDGEAI